MNIKFLSALTAVAFALPLLTSAAATGTAQQAQSAQNQATQQKSALAGLLCPKPAGSLKRGSSGADVTRLQQFLAQDRSIYPEGIVSGTFGPLTEKAVQRFQVKNGIVNSGTPSTTGYGAVGPRTAAAMALGCAGASTPSPTSVVGGFIAVSPYARGNSRSIAVQVTANAANSCSASTYILDYGDNTGKSPVTVAAGTCRAVTSTINHTYQLAGTYQVTLSTGSHKTSVVVSVQ
ncbi:MAG: peptidoglycan-binding domain-containing protein [bacterium]|nr:peptidoglycan-binding domain-containing protein [bacterium]